MQTPSARRCKAILAIASVSAWVSPAPADQGDVINFIAGANAIRDDNVFRLPDGLGFVEGAGFVPGGVRSDTVRNLFAGITLDKTLGRQRIAGQLTASRVRYDRFDFLGYDSTGGQASWQWRLGNRWNGEASYERSEALTSFDDFRTPVKNLTTLEAARFAANYWLHPDWTLVAALGTARGRNTTASRLENDFDRGSVEAGVRFGPATGNRIGLNLRRSALHYPNRAAGSTFDNDNTLYDLELDGLWAVTGASRLSGRAGYRRMLHDERTERDFGGTTARLAYDWTPRPATAVNFAVRREISSYETISTSFIDTRAVSVSPRWAPSAKTLLQARVEVRLLSYRGDIGSGSPRREDTGWVTSLTATWTPLRNASLSLSVQHDRRDSNTPNNSYRDNLASLSGQLQF